jgi:Ni,Fe-hydrogenase III large subunit
MSNHPRTTIPFGPQHPVLPEPVQLQITYEDEKVIDVVPAFGYGHRGIEKGCELSDYNQSLFLCERICGFCSLIHGVTFCRAVENVYGAEIPQRADALRVFWMEMTRVHSHLLWTGLFAEACGFESIFMQYARIRERVMDLLELTTGHRITHSISIIGGVRRDMNDEQAEIAKKELTLLRKEVEALNKVIEKDPTIKFRTIGRGIINKDDAIKWGTVGPVLRGSGVAEDMRSLDSNFYKDFGFEPITEANGDCYSRMKVRTRETLQAIDIQLYLLEHLPKGEIALKLKGNPPEGESIARTEQPRGECFYYIKSNGTKQLDRVRVKTPTYSNLPSLLVMLPGMYHADVPVIIHSLDPCISCTER